MPKQESPVLLRDRPVLNVAEDIRVEDRLGTQVLLTLPDIEIGGSGRDVCKEESSLQGRVLPFDPHYNPAACPPGKSPTNQSLRRHLEYENGHG